MGNSKMDETMRFKAPKDEEISTEEIILHVYSALKEKGYNPINQIVGYLISDDPSYITGYMDARSIIKKVEREDLIEELVKYYLQER